MYRIIMCDDREYCREFIRNTISETFRSLEEDYMLTEYSSGDAFLFSMRSGIADIAIFDVEMSGTNGIETAKKYRDIDPNAVIIFATAHEETVFSSFMAEPLTFLTKPIQKEALRETLKRAVEKVNTIRSEKYTFEANKSVYAVPVRELVYLASINRMILVHALKGEYEYYGKLKDAEKHPLLKDFIRCHQSYLVNPDYIQEISGKEIILSDSSVIPIRRGMSKEVKARFLEYLSNLTL